MSFKPPKGWDRESDTLFIHATGVRIQRRMYRDREGWFLIPTDLAREVTFFEPTPEGRDQAFAAFAKVQSCKKPAKKKAIPAKLPITAKKGLETEEDPEDDPEEDSEEEAEEKPEGKGTEDGAEKVDTDS